MTFFERGHGGLVTVSPDVDLLRCLRSNMRWKATEQENAEKQLASPRLCEDVINRPCREFEWDVPKSLGIVVFGVYFDIGVPAGR